MNYNLLFEKAKLAGVQALEIYESTTKKTNINIFKNEVDKFQIASTKVLAIRGIYQGKMGNVYTENLNDEQIELVIDRLIDNAACVDSDDEQIIFSGSERYIDFSNFNDMVLNVEVAEKIEKLKEIENLSMAKSDKMDNVSPMYSEAYQKVVIKNSMGVDLEKEDVYYYYYVSGLAKDGEDRASAAYIHVGRDFNEVTSEEIAQELSEEAINKLGSTAIESGLYNTVLDKKAATSLFGVLVNSFSAEQVQKGTSKLKGQLGEVVFGDNISIYDDPFRKDGWGSTSFDDEAMATRNTHLVSQGKLMNYLYNLKTAKKDGVESTGNGFKSSVASSVGITPTNIYIEPGEKDLKDLLAGFNGVYITDLAGVHAGTNPISGDFSLQCNGFLYKNGEVVQPINLITISGNIFDMLNNVEDIASDLKFLGSNYASPSLKVAPMQISGK